MARQEHLLVGKIVGSHGIKGAVKVYSYAESAEIFSAGRNIRLEDLNERVSSKKILWARPHGKVLRVSLEGVTNAEQASELKGSSLFIERKSLPDLDEGMYYWCDLIGLNVYSENEEFIGQIHTIITTGSNDVYVVKDPRENGKGETLIPALASVVRAVDIAQGVMHVTLPEGL